MSHTVQPEDEAPYNMTSLLAYLRVQSLHRRDYEVHDDNEKETSYVEGPINQSLCGILVAEWG